MRKWEWNSILLLIRWIKSIIDFKQFILVLPCHTTHTSHFIVALKVKRHIKMLAIKILMLSIFARRFIPPHIHIHYSQTILYLLAWWIYIYIRNIISHTMLCIYGLLWSWEIEWWRLSMFFYVIFFFSWNFRLANIIFHCARY